MSTEGFQSIVPVLAAHGIRLDPTAQSRIERYVALLEHWNRRINLVGTRDPKTLWHRHVLDCLMLEGYPRDPALLRWLDAGSGAGLPAVLLAILHPHWQVTAAERVARKATFLQEVVRTLALDNLTVLRADVHRLGDALDFVPYDALVARAFAPLDELLVLGRKLLRPAGELWAMKGRSWKAEAARVPPAVLAAYEAPPRVHTYRLGDHGGGDGFVLVYRRHKQAPTEA